MSESKMIEVVQGRRGSRRGALLFAGILSFSVAYLAGQQLFYRIIGS